MHDFQVKDIAEQTHMLLVKAQQELDRVHGDGFAAKNPSVAIQLCIAYSLNLIVNEVSRVG